MKKVAGLSMFVVILLSSASFGYFTDDFTYSGDPTPLNARWTAENSPQNAAGSDLTIVGWGDGVAQAAGTLNAVYNHIQTSIDASGNFAVESNVRQNNPGSWAASLMVYWDPTHFIRFGQGDNFFVIWNDGTGSQAVNSATACGGWSWFAQRLEFTDTSIKFYASAGPNPGEAPVTPTLLADINIARGAWSKVSDALLIVGKGYQGYGYDNPDFDNDYVEIGGADYLAIDYVNYTPEPATMMLFGLGSLALLRRKKA